MEENGLHSSECKVNPYYAIDCLKNDFQYVAFTQSHITLTLMYLLKDLIVW